jgi:peptidoglycan/LPS O-acetylase OafA/YrhL
MLRDPTPAEPAHVPALDGVRGLAILLVMLLHLWTIPSVTRLDWALFYGTNLGWFGVDLFFVLSGYLITGILLDAKGAERYFRNFYVRRVLRIFPLYYVILIASLYVLPQLLPPEKALRFGSIAGDAPYYWLYLSNFAMARAGYARHGVLDVTWSLAIEEQFYLVWPALVFLCSRRALVRIAAGLGVASLALRIGLHFFSRYNAYSIYVLTPCHLEPIVAGAILAAWAREPGGLARFKSQARLAVFAMLPLVITIPIAEEILEPPNQIALGLGPIFVTIGFTLLAVLFGGLLVLVATAEPGSALHRVFTTSLLRTFGKYSYGVYLVHLPLRALIRDRIFGPSGPGPRFHFPKLAGSELPGQLLFYVLAAGVSLGVAWVSFQLFEKQFLKLKRFFPSGAGPRTTAALTVPNPDPHPDPDPDPDRS